MVSIYFSLTGSVSLLSAFIVSLLPTRWSHRWLLCTIFPFLSFLLWFCDICPQGRSESLSPFMQGNCAALSRTKIANLNGVLTPNTVKYHTRGFYPIQGDTQTYSKDKTTWKSLWILRFFICNIQSSYIYLVHYIPLSKCIISAFPNQNVHFTLYMEVHI